MTTVCKRQVEDRTQEVNKIPKSNTLFWRFIHFIEFKILHIDDSPRRISLGVAVGFFVAWSPLFGFHLLMAIGLAFLFRANKFAAIVSAWICNPLTMIFIYYPNYFMGRAIVSSFRVKQSVDISETSALLEELFSLRYIVSSFYTAEFWRRVGSALVQTGVEMMVGGIVLGGIVATAGYFTTYRIIVWYRTNHPHRYNKRKKYF